MVPASIRRVLLAQHRVDFRKRFDGLLAEAYRLGANPYEGDCVLFVQRHHTQLRAIVGDAVGLYLISRRFEGGRLNRLVNFVADPTATETTAAELSLLLEGATFSIHSRAKRWTSPDGCSLRG